MRLESPYEAEARWTRRGNLLDRQEEAFLIEVLLAGLPYDVCGLWGAGEGAGVGGELPCEVVQDAAERVGLRAGGDCRVGPVGVGGGPGKVLGVQAPAGL
ncbi:hypothetical protein [Streptomyces sp. NBC_00576]|uniref:hypothetical protein n=1 Tax=Streptomyces sp. NBC_00576 TaxID=2903665 RepID=UPI002E811A12|nr:hypothetical protein [Streptomyces sp. NBC_00576]WUB69321.1 hypothetical protein OG734_04030 [Streptomyces sp. NBC_00576]